MPIQGRSAEECDNANMKSVKDMIEMFPQFEMKVQYQVRVVEQSSDISLDNIGDDTGDLRELSTSVKLIEEALEFLVNYFQLKSSAMFLRLSKDTLRLLFMVSMSFSNFLELFQKKKQSGATNVELERLMVGMGLLVNGQPTRNNLINKHVLYVTSERYNELHESIERELGLDDSQDEYDRNCEESADDFEAVVFDL